MTKGVVLSSALFLLIPLSPASALTPNDPLFTEQWYLPRIEAPAAWDVTRGDPSVVVAVIDSGVDIDHPDLAPNIWKNPKEIAGDGVDNDNNGFVDDMNGWDFLTDSPDPRPKAAPDIPLTFAHHHGTAVAGVIAAVGDNGKGVSGIAPNATIMALRALDSEGKGKSATVIHAIEYAVENGAAIINLSFVADLIQPQGALGNHSGFFRAIERARRSGVLVIAAAGNEATAEGIAVVDLDVNPLVPACEDVTNPFQSVLGVAATDEEDHRAVFSSFGRRCIDLSAPGRHFFTLKAQREPIPGVSIESYGGYFNGTSMAAPVVSGIAALMKSVNHLLSADDIQTILEATAEPVERGTIYDGRLGKGRVNARRAVERAVKQLPPLAQSVVAARTPSEEVVVEAKPQSQSQEVSPLPLDAILLALNDGKTSHLVYRQIDSLGDPIGLFRIPGTVTGLAELSTREIVVGRVRPGKPTDVLVLTPDGVLVRSWQPFGKKFTQSISFAVGDVNGDGAEDIIVAGGGGAAPEVRAFNTSGKLKTKFLAYAKSVRGRVDVAVGDVDGDGRAEIVTVPQSHSPAEVRVFDAKGKKKVQFTAGGKKNQSGASLALGKSAVGEKEQIVIARVEKTRGVVRVFGADGKEQRQFRAFEKTSRAFLVRRGAGDTIIVATREKPSVVNVFNLTGARVSSMTVPKGIASVAFCIIRRDVSIRSLP